VTGEATPVVCTGRTTSQPPSITSTPPATVQVTSHGAPLLPEAEAEQLSLEPNVSAVSLPTLSYQDWPPHWQSLTQRTSTNIVLVPAEACRVTTPLNALAWSVYLQLHPHQQLVQFFLGGITEGLV